MLRAAILMFLASLSFAAECARADMADTLGQFTGYTIGKNPLWVAKQHGHSVQTMLEVYAAWTEGAKESDIEAIKRAMGVAPD